MSLSVCEGDHVMTEDGLSGIVVGIGEKMSQLELARFPSDDHRGPGLVVINDVDRQIHTRSRYIFYPNSTKMWANAQRDGRPAEHRWRPLFNAAKFG